MASPHRTSPQTNRRTCKGSWNATMVAMLKSRWPATLVFLCILAGTNYILLFPALEQTIEQPAKTNEKPNLRIPVADRLSRDYDIVISKTDPPIAVSVHAQGDIVSNHIKKQGYWDGGLTEVVSAVLASKKQPQTIVDFGANVGWFSLLAVSKGHQSIAVEPMSSNRGALLQSISLNNYDDSIELVSAALGDGSPDSPTSLCIQPRVLGSNIGNGQTTVNIDGCGEVVQVRTLSSIIGNRKVDFVKADCEGCEANALMGMKDIILGRSPPCAMAIEWRPDSMKELGGDPKMVTELLVQSGYMFFRQSCNLVTGEGLELSEVSSTGLPSLDLVLLHDSKRCFQRNGEAFRYVMDRVASFQPIL